MGELNKTASESFISAYLQKNELVEKLAESLTDACANVNRLDFKELIEAVVRKYVLRNWKSFDGSAENYIDMICSGLKMMSGEVKTIYAENRDEITAMEEVIDRRLCSEKVQRDLNEFADYLNSELGEEGMEWRINDGSERET